jgi:hypothetical protein
VEPLRLVVVYGLECQPHARTERVDALHGPELATHFFWIVPAGVSGHVGWANRLLFATTYLWAVLAARSVLSLPRRRSG